MKLLTIKPEIKTLFEQTLLYSGNHRLVGITQVPKAGVFGSIPHLSLKPQPCLQTVREILQDTELL
jgi:hypothetical protein